MKKFIVITGPMGVGKTSVGKLLCDKLGRAAFIDGDWCLDIHPFIGNKETINMAIDNIVHLTRNYFYCSECDYVVLSWVISENNIKKIIEKIFDLDFKVYSFTLICNKEVLVDRWHKDITTEWRVDEWLNRSIESLESYKDRKETIAIETSKISVDKAAEKIIDIIA